MAVSQVKIDGLVGVSEKLERSAQLDDVKKVVRGNAAELAVDM